MSISNWVFKKTTRPTIVDQMFLETEPTPTCHFYKFELNISKTPSTMNTRMAFLTFKCCEMAKTTLTSTT